MYISNQPLSVCYCQQRTSHGRGQRPPHRPAGLLPHREVPRTRRHRRQATASTAARSSRKPRGRRQIANRRAMLLQLCQLRRELRRGAYVLDGFRRQVLAHPSRIGTASGFRPLNQPTPGTAAVSSDDGIAAAVESLEAALSNTREFVAFLSACPRVTRQLVPVHGGVHVWTRPGLLACSATGAS
jgi:hypothetical protein